MAGLIALVGGNEFQPGCEAMDRALLSELGPRPKVVIVPTAAARENPGLAAENGRRYFQRLGAQAEAAMVVDPETARQSLLIDPVKKADLVYLPGGDPAYLLATLRDSLLWEAIQEVLRSGRMLAGSSAGAMILGGQMWAPGKGWRPGLSLLPQIAVIPHHSRLASRWNAERMRASLPKGMMLVGVDEATALFGPPWRVLGPGQVLLYPNQEATIFADGQTVPL